MPSILLLRHAQASLGAADYDVLSERGHVQAAATAEELRRRGTRIDRLVSGTLVRQRDTAAPIAAVVEREVELDARWNEYDSDDILTVHSAASARLHADPDGAPTLSSHDFQQLLDTTLGAWMRAGDASATRETWPGFQARVQAALHELGATLGRGETALVCTSGGVLAAACAALIGAPQSFVPLHRVVVNAAFSTIAVGRSGMTLLAFNEHAHLLGDPEGLVTFR